MKKRVNYASGITVDKHIKRCSRDVIYDVILFVILTIIFLIVAYPLYFVIISSVSDPIAVANGEVTFFQIGVLFFKFLSGILNQIFRFCRESYENLTVLLAPSECAGNLLGGF